MKNDLVVIKFYYHLWQVEMAKNLLQNHNIVCIIQSDSIGDFGSRFNQHNGLVVAAKDAEKAKDILDKYFSLS